MQSYEIMLSVDDNNEITRFYELLELNLQIINPKFFAVEVSQNCQGQYVRFVCRGWALKDRTFYSVTALIDAMSSALTDYIIEVKEQQILAQLVRRTYKQAGRKAVHDIVALVTMLLDGEEEGEDYNKWRMSLREYMKDKVMRYFTCNRLLNVEGFIRFRLKEYQHHLRGMVEHGIDEYLIQKEYD